MCVTRLCVLALPDSIGQKLRGFNGLRRWPHPRPLPLKGRGEETEREGVGKAPTPSLSGDWRNEQGLHVTPVACVESCAGSPESRGRAFTATLTPDPSPRGRGELKTEREGMGKAPIPSLSESWRIARGLHISRLREANHGRFTDTTVGRSPRPSHSPIVSPAKNAGFDRELGRQLREAARAAPRERPTLLFRRPAQ